MTTLPYPVSNRQLTFNDLPNETDGETDPLPKRIADKFSFPLPEQTYNGKQVYLVTAWVSGITQKKNVKRLIADLKRLNPKGFDSIVPLSHETKGGMQTAFFADSQTLYSITVHLQANSGIRDEVIGIMSASTEFTDWAFRNPEAAAAGFLKIVEQKQLPPARQTKEYRRALDSGYSDADAQHWVDIDRRAKESRKTWVSEVVSRGGNVADLTNFVTRLATGKRATDWKRDMRIAVSPRQYFSPLKKLKIEFLEYFSTAQHRKNNSHGQAALASDIADLSDVINWDKLAQIEADRDLRLPAPKPEQKLLGDGK